MYIKASGTPLKDMDAEHGWCRLKLPAVLAIIRDSSLSKMPPDIQPRQVGVTQRLLCACEDRCDPSARPSVESLLHTILARCVVHLHPLAVGAYVNARQGKARIRALFRGEKPLPLWVSYADPGFALATRVAHLVADYESRHKTKPTIIFLEKHGLIVSTDSARTAVLILRRIIKRCSSGLKPAETVRPRPIARRDILSAKLAIRQAVFNTTGEYTAVRHRLNGTVATFLARPDAPRLLAAGSLSPDELLHLNGAPLWLKQWDSEQISRKLLRQIADGRKPARAFITKSLGLFVAGPVKMLPAAEQIAVASLFIRSRAAGLGGLRCLSHSEQNFINESEAETFRLQLATGTNRGELAGRIAIVTGAGSGLGRSIAIGLAREGALVAAADIDVKGAEGTVNLIKKELPAASAVALRCDVSNEKDVDGAYRRLLDDWGGLDILVNAAGIAPAYPLVELPADKWRLTVEVNLTGYFLMARCAARIMIAQKIGGNIIHISSKSGLEASKDNTPYNATKAAEIHMARGWAMELGEYGIRVNSIAPGNVFEGSKIWNPEYIKVCAKKYGIKPQEVIPFYIAKTHLKREIKGQDVADAVVFLCSDKARTITGQTLVVDSGQVFVR
jgi:NAD(P)-dependent dehydrogenase (short-subunit alcohol dehydrogenase family)/rhamnose utilization protein RhaD (predicted bifunctional aldolase and dehydrogenase)